MANNSKFEGFLLPLPSFWGIQRIRGGEKKQLPRVPGRPRSAFRGAGDVSFVDAVVGQRLREMEELEARANGLNRIGDKCTR